MLMFLLMKNSKLVSLFLMFDGYFPQDTQDRYTIYI